MPHIGAPAPSTCSTLLLVHGSWHDGTCWSAVQQRLAAVGVRSIAPTLPGHGPDDDRLNVSHQDYVGSVADVLDGIRESAVLVGHSLGGTVISRVAELRPEQCHGLVYCSAFVPRHGERVADSLPEHFIDFLDLAAGASADRTIELPDEILREAFANTADDETVARIRTLLVPEPHAPIFETLSLPSFPTMEIPTVYVNCRQDQTMPPGTFHPIQSSRLRDPELIEIDGDHEALLTAPEHLADALIAALDAIDTSRHADPKATRRAPPTTPQSGRRAGHAD
jgi:pimeloyl-ACP methyl ester carboxylesterase